jgi:hypothetical protein
MVKVYKKMMDDVAVFIRKKLYLIVIQPFKSLFKALFKMLHVLWL